MRRDVVDAASYSRDLNDLPPGDLFTANADRTVGTLVFGFPNSEAIMQQGAFFNDELFLREELFADEFES